MFRSATFKLTLWYLAIVTAISLAFSLSVYHFATQELHAGLYSQTQRIYNNFPVFNNSPLLIPGRFVAAGAHHILLELVYFNLLVLFLAGFASYFLARRTLQPIETAHERQKRFTADVSHELRTPLTAIKMGSEVALLDETTSRQDLRAALHSNLEEADKMGILINNLLRLSQLDAGQVQNAFQTVSSDVIVGTAIDRLSAQAASKQVPIVQHGKAHTLFGDPESLEQLLIILLDNAVKYSPAAAEVSIGVSGTGTETVITVRDHGSGIAAEALPHVFDRFYREDSSRAKTTEGYGLGLSIAKLICDRHNGQLVISSPPGRGTAATIYLPAKAPA